MDTITDRAWLAGFLDGEGTFQVVRHIKHGDKHFPSGSKLYEHYSAEVCAVNTDKRLVDRCREIAGGFVMGPFRVSSKGGSAKSAYRWVLKGTKVSQLLGWIAPLLVGKSEQARILVLMREITTRGAARGRFGRVTIQGDMDRRRTLKDAIHALNHRGTTPVAPHQQESLAIARKWLAPQTTSDKTPPTLP
jgi:hypothetical protein